MNLAFHRIKAAGLSSSACTRVAPNEMIARAGLSLARECVYSPPYTEEKFGWTARLFHRNHKAAELSRERSVATKKFCVKKNKNKNKKENDSADNEYIWSDVCRRSADGRIQG